MSEISAIFQHFAPHAPTPKRKPLNNRDIYIGNFCLTKMATIL